METVVITEDSLDPRTLKLGTMKGDFTVTFYIDSEKVDEFSVYPRTEATHDDQLEAC